VIIYPRRTASEALILRVAIIMGILKILVCLHRGLGAETTWVADMM
jgi:hypothetical protein